MTNTDNLLSILFSIKYFVIPWKYKILTKCKEITTVNKTKNKEQQIYLFRWRVQKNRH